MSRHRFQLNDIVLGRRGEMGRCAVIGPSQVGWLCGTGSMLIRFASHHIVPDYLQLALSQPSLAEILELQSSGATMSNLNAQMVGSIAVPVPPLSEQERIVNARERVHQVVSYQKQRYDMEIELMQEYRTRLISDVVTGKVRVA
jgi:type I restriction enzyme S subunit